MNKKKLKSIVKYVKPIYKAYNELGNVGISFLKRFVKPNDELILFASFGGQKYDDSPRVIYEKMKKDKRFKRYTKVWALDHPEQFPEIKNVVKMDTPAYFKIALEARVWVTNSSIERGLNFKGKNTFYFDTWHGTPIKLMGTDISTDNTSFNPNGDHIRKSPIDVMMAQSNYEADIFSRTFVIDRDRFLLAGLPRNDELANYTKITRQKYRKKLGIKDDQIAILYMPTFREYTKDKDKEIVAAPPLSLDRWKEKLGRKYVFLFRAHYEVAKVMNITENGFIKNVTMYPTLNELLIASDILISDYSSTFFDYSIMDKPMLHFTYDYDEYSQKRGMYFDIRNELDGANNEDDLIEIIKNFDVDAEIKKTIKFRNKYVNYYGHATEAALDCIYNNLQCATRNNKSKMISAFLE